MRCEEFPQDGLPIGSFFCFFSIFKGFDYEILLLFAGVQTFTDLQSTMGKTFTVFHLLHCEQLTKL